jgi:pheromone shutdown protein TraB
MRRWARKKFHSTHVVETDIDVLLERGVLRVWRKRDAPVASLSGGARGSGHTASTAQLHIEPEEIWVVGTSHLSAQSASDVETVIRAIRPDNVVVELCRSRAGIMYATDNQTSALQMTGSSFIDTLRRSLALGGPSAFLLRALLAKSPALTSQSIGGDFRAARIAGEEISAKIVLGDRPIEITLERAWSALTWDEKVRAARLLQEIVLARPSQKADDQTKLNEMSENAVQNPAVVGTYEEVLATNFPSLVQPLITER